MELAQILLVITSRSKSSSTDLDDAEALGFILQKEAFSQNLGSKSRSLEVVSRRSGLLRSMSTGLGFNRRKMVELEVVLVQD